MCLAAPRDCGFSAHPLGRWAAERSFQKPPPPMPNNWLMFQCPLRAASGVPERLDFGNMDGSLATPLGLVEVDDLTLPSPAFPGGRAGQTRRTPLQGLVKVGSRIAFVPFSPCAQRPHPRRCSLPYAARHRSTPRSLRATRHLRAQVLAPPPSPPRAPLFLAHPPPLP